MRKSIYLAGPDVFFPQPAQHADKKLKICSDYGFKGITPLNPDTEDILKMPNEEAWRVIYLSNIKLIQESDMIVANLTPFLGVSADAGTLIEVGLFLGMNKHVYGYSNTRRNFSHRIENYMRSDVSGTWLGEKIEDLDQPDNLMVSGAVVFGGGYPIFTPRGIHDLNYDDLTVFERCIHALSLILLD